MRLPQQKKALPNREPNPEDMPALNKSGRPANALLVRILERAFDKDALNEIFEKYEEAKFSRGRRYYEPTPQEISLFKQWQRGAVTLAGAAKELGCSSTSVKSHFLLIAANRNYF